MHNCGYICENSPGMRCLTQHLDRCHLLSARMEQIPALTKDFCKGSCYLPQTEEQMLASPGVTKSTEVVLNNHLTHTTLSIFPLHPCSHFAGTGLQDFPCPSSLSSGCPWLQAHSSLLYRKSLPCAEAHIPSHSPGASLYRGPWGSQVSSV